ncbi:MAG: hypothetical protein QM704_23180 [Anaeromyxobacteraceae bacterium]
MTPGTVQLSCSRCFKVFDAPEDRASAVPLCDACAARGPSMAARGRPAGRPARAPADRPAVLAAVAAGAVLLAALGGVAWWRSRPPPEPPSPRRGEVQDRIQGWKAAGLVPASPPGDPRRFAEARAHEARELLRADLPGRTREALAAFRQAVAADPTVVAAIAGFAEAVADASDEDADAEELRAAHLFLDAAADAAPKGAPPRAALAAARARLLLLVDATRNLEEARAAAGTAVAAAPGDAASALALGLATGVREPARAADALLEAYRKDPGDRRLLSAAAQARRAAGTDADALALAEERLSLDPGHPGSLHLVAVIRESAGQRKEARAALERWRGAEPEAWEPLYLLARLAWQADGDLAGARALAAEALPRAKGAFAASRVLALTAGILRAQGDEAGARARAAEAVARVPGAAPARFQAALSAWRAGDPAALRESAGVLGDRAGPSVASLLALRAGELAGRTLESFEAWREARGLETSDPRTLLAAAAALHHGLAESPALEVARAFLAQDPLEVRLERAPGDFDEGPAPAADACDRLEALGRAARERGERALSAAAACHLAFGHGVRAEALARAAGALTPQAAAPQWILAQVALDLGKPRVAFPLARGAVEDDPGSAVAREVLARTYEAFGREADAAEERASPTAQRARLVTTRLAVARAAARAGRRDEALALARALAAERPDLVAPRALLLELSLR